MFDIQFKWTEFVKIQIMITSWIRRKLLKLYWYDVGDSEELYVPSYIYLNMYDIDTNQRSIYFAAAQIGN